MTRLAVGVHGSVEAVPCVISTFASTTVLEQEGSRGTSGNHNTLCSGGKNVAGGMFHGILKGRDHAWGFGETFGFTGIVQAHV